MALEIINLSAAQALGLFEAMCDMVGADPAARYPVKVEPLTIIIGKDCVMVEKTADTGLETVEDGEREGTDHG